MLQALLLTTLLAQPTSFPSEASKFSIGIELSTQVPPHPMLKSAIEDLGIDFVNYYVYTFPGADALPPEEVNRAMLEFCEELGLDHALSSHVYDPPPAAIAQSAQAAASGETRFLGVILDEVEHVRLLNNHAPEPIANTVDIRSITEAYAVTLEGYRKTRERLQSEGAPEAIATHMWPVLNHLAARAGFIVCPKICKEFYSPVNLALGIGAARQYDRPLWADLDLWLWGNVPGHPPEEFRSNLLLAYWMGVDRLYIEGAGHNLLPAGNQGHPFSLMGLISDREYQLTEYGEILRWFTHEYIPRNPRPWTFRDVRPNIVIVRFEDTCHGQRYTAHWKDWLYGSSHLQSTPDTEAWFGLWNLLTHGATNRDGLTAFKISVARGGHGWRPKKGLRSSTHGMPHFVDRHRFFVPANGVVVYDHLVGYDLLKDVPLLFLTGVEVSPETLEAIRRRVEEGAICVAWGPLASRNGFPEWKSGVEVIPHGNGRFVLTDDFGVQGVFNEINGMIGFPHLIQYRFGEHEVILRRVLGDDNRVEAEVHYGK